MTTARTPNLPATFNAESPDFEAAMRAAGFLAEKSKSDFNRIKPVGTTFVYDDEVIAAYNPKTKEPAMVVQIVDQPAEYQSLWFDKDGQLAMAVERPGIAGKFCKSHYDIPEQNRERAEDGTNCRECPVHPFVPRDQLPPEADGRKCAWKADIEFRILDKQDDGTYALIDDRIYTMSLSTTSVIEFKGSNSKQNKPQAGSVSDENFMVKLAKLGFTKWGQQGLLKAMTNLRLGGVIAEVRLLPAANKEAGRNWNVVSFTPIEILEQSENNALENGGDVSTDDIPF